jgi:hypothetical protein
MDVDMCSVGVEGADAEVNVPIIEEQKHRQPTSSIHRQGQYNRSFALSSSYYPPRRETEGTSLDEEANLQKKTRD